MRKIHFEEPDILAAALHPGWIATCVLSEVDVGVRAYWLVKWATRAPGIGV